jgi:hypothetical protein
MTPAIKAALSATTDGSLATELRAAGVTSLAARCDLDRACKSAVSGDCAWLRIFAKTHIGLCCRPTDFELRAAARELMEERCRVCGEMEHPYRHGCSGAGKTMCEWEATAE